MKHLQYLMYGAMVVLSVLVFYIIMLIVIGAPMAIAYYTKNDNWLWLYIISGVVILYFIGRQLNEIQNKRQ